MSKRKIKNLIARKLRRLKNKKTKNKKAWLEHTDQESKRKVKENGDEEQKEENQ